MIRTTSLDQQQNVCSKTGKENCTSERKLYPFSSLSNPYTCHEREILQDDTTEGKELVGWTSEAKRNSVFNNTRGKWLKQDRGS